jgi:hypothetical protein
LQKWRIGYFVCMTISIWFVPLAQHALIYSPRETFAFVRASL